MNEKIENVMLTSGEISSLWTTYINDSVVICMMKHFLETCSDPEVLIILEKTFHIADKHMKLTKELFVKEKIVVPEAFPIEKHVVPNAPKLFSDMLYIQNVHQLSRFAVASHNSGLTISAREDVRKMYKEYSDDASQLYNDVVDTMLRKGIYVRLPFMNYPKEIDFVDKQKFLTGWFGRRRPLLGIEVTHLVLNSIHNEMGRATCTGFSQVAQEQEIRDYFVRGKHISTHMVDSIHDVLVESDVPAAMSWDQSVTTSTVAPFSDQLMLYIIGVVSNLGLASYGTAMATTMRRDISAMYAGFMAKGGAFGEDGMNMMIDRRWMEQPPQYEDHDKLANRK